MLCSATSKDQVTAKFIPFFRVLKEKVWQKPGWKAGVCWMLIKGITQQVFEEEPRNMVCLSQIQT